MSVSKEYLEFLLTLWARYREKEFREVSWSGLSITGKCCEAIETGIFSHGTKHHTPNYDLPEDIELIQRAMLELPLTLQQIIKAEYERGGYQRHKARSLKLTVTNYRARLCRAKQKLMLII